MSFSCPAAYAPLLDSWTAAFIQGYVQECLPLSGIQSLLTTIFLILRSEQTDKGTRGAFVGSALDAAGSLIAGGKHCHTH